MKRSIATLSTLLLVGAAAEVWAGPAEEVAQISKPRLQALEEGNLEVFVAAFADNAVLHPGLSPFRIEGNEGIRAYYAEVFHTYPKRRVFLRQPSMRVYNDDLVIQNSYSVLHYTDQKGEIKTYALRGSMTWAKVGGSWQIVDQHVSRIPVAP